MLYNIRYTLYMYYNIYNILCIHVIFYMCRCVYNYVLYAYTYTYIFHLHINKIFQFSIELKWSLTCAFLQRNLQWKPLNRMQFVSLSLNNDSQLDFWKGDINVTICNYHCKKLVLLIYSWMNHFKLWIRLCCYISILDNLAQIAGWKHPCSVYNFCEFSSSSNFSDLVGNEQIHMYKVKMLPFIVQWLITDF